MQTAGIDEASQNVLGHAGGLSALERHENDLEAAQRPAAPEPVLGDEGATGKALRQWLALVQGKTERGGSAPSAQSRTMAFANEVRTRRLGLRIEVLPQEL